MVKVKVKQSHYRPGQALRVPWGWGSQILRQLAHEGDKVFRPKHRPPLPQEIFLVLIFVRGWVEPRAIVRPEGLCQWKIPMTPLGTEPATFRLVAQCLNQLRHRTLTYFVDGGSKYLRNLSSYVSLHAASRTKHVYLSSPSVKTADLYPTFFTMLYQPIGITGPHPLPDKSTPHCHVSSLYRLTSMNQ
jgi:hypothetical protein